MRIDRMTPKQKKLYEKIADEIEAALMSDSNISLDDKMRAKLIAAIEKDGPSSFTSEEIDEFIMGGEEGLIPSSLKRKYRFTHRFIERLYF